MALEKVGYIGGNRAWSQGAGNPVFYVTANVDSGVFQVGDVVIFAVSGTPTYPGALTYPTEIEVRTRDTDVQLTKWASIEDNTFDGYWYLVAHELTQDDFDANPSFPSVPTSVDFAVITTTAAVAVQAMGGVVVRGGDYSTLRVLQDTDSGTAGEVNVASASGSTGTFSAVTPADTGIGTLLYYLNGSLNATALTANAAAWTGATELFADEFVQNAFSTRDPFWSSAYRIVTEDDPWPADAVTRTVTGTSVGSSAWRFGFIFGEAPYHAPTPGTAPSFEPSSRRVDIRELPHEVTSVMFDDL